MAVRKIIAPAANEPVVMPDGSVNPNWYLFFKFVETLSPLSDIPAIVPPSPLTPGNTTVSITARSISDSLNIGVGVDASVIGYASSVQSLYDSFTTIKNALNTYSTNHTNSKSAIDAINVRVTSLENKINAIIAALS